jgi:hypothetical protein
VNPLLLGRLALVASVFLAGWWVNGWRWETKYQKLDAQYQSFGAGVAKLGEQAKAKNALIALDQLKAKERADEQNRRITAGLRADIKRLRDDRARSGSGVVPAAPAGSVRPDLACFGRTELERAYGELVTEVRGLADEGTAATVDLDTTKKWADETRAVPK